MINNYNEWIRIRKLLELYGNIWRTNHELHTLTGGKNSFFKYVNSNLSNHKNPTPIINNDGTSLYDNISIAQEFNRYFAQNSASLFFGYWRY